MNVKLHFCFRSLTSTSDPKGSVVAVLWRLREDFLSLLMIDTDMISHCINQQTAFLTRVYATPFREHYLSHA